MIFKDFFPIVRLRFGSVYAKEERAEYVCSNRQPIADWLFVAAEVRLAARAENAVGHETCCAAERERAGESLAVRLCKWAPVCVCACVKECLCMWMPESEPGRERLCERSWESASMQSPNCAVPVQREHRRAQCAATVFACWLNALCVHICMCRYSIDSVDSACRVGGEQKG